MFRLRRLADKKVFPIENSAARELLVNRQVLEYFSQGRESLVIRRRAREPRQGRHIGAEIWFDDDKSESREHSPLDAAPFGALRWCPRSQELASLATTLAPLRGPSRRANANVIFGRSSYRSVSHAAAHAYPANSRISIV